MTPKAVRRVLLGQLWAIAVVLLCGWLLDAGTALAQMPAPEEAAAEAPAEPEPAPAPEEKGPTFPKELGDPAIETDTLTLRLIPLTADQLGALAGEWLGIVQQATEQVVDQQITINGTEADAVEESARERLTELTEARGALFDKYNAILDAWELKGGDPATVTGYRTYRNAIMVEETRNTDWRTLVAKAWNWVISPDGGLKVALKVGIFAAAVLGLMIAASFVRGGVRFWTRRIPDFSKLLGAFLALVAYWITLAIGLMLVLGALGVNVTPLFALVGGASFILAFAMQNTLSNLAAGLMLMINRPFDEGDSVDIGGVSGTVRDVSIVSTTVLTPDNQVVVVPNSSVWGNVITNSTASTTRRVDLQFAVSHDTPIERAQEELEKTVRAHPKVLEEPEPVVRVNSLTDNGVDFIVRPWVKSGDYQSVYWDLTRQVKGALDRAGMKEVEPGGAGGLKVEAEEPA